MNPHTIFRWRDVTLCLAVASLTFGVESAERSDPSNPTGTWQWTLVTANGQTYERSLRLEQAGDRLTGISIWPDGAEVAVQEGRIKGNELSFTLTRQQADQKVVSKYRGKINGDTIRGTIDSPFNGQPRNFDWQAKRVKERAPSPATGTWAWSLTDPNGPTIEPSAKLKQEGQAVTGVVNWSGREQPISEGKFKDGELSFKVQSERDGRTVTSSYQGKLDGDTIKGNRESNWTGENVSRAWEAKRVGK